MSISPIPKPSQVPEIALTPLAVLTGKNQLTVAEGVSDNFPDADCFEVTIENGRIVLTPFEISAIEDVWAKIAALGITEEDVADAVEWARGR